MTLLRTLSQEARRSVALSKFNVGAKPFVPGKQWMKPKRLSWNPMGITSVKYFNYELGSLSRQKGTNSSLKGPPASPIKDADPKAAQPFLIPTPYTAKKILDKKIPSEKLKSHGYPSLFMDELTIQEYESIQKDREQNSGLYRTQPSRYNYCDN